MGKKTEWVAVLHGQTGTVKIAYRNPLMLARGLEGQTSEGWTVARVYERECETYDAVCSTCNGMGRIHGIGAARACPDCRVSHGA